MSHETFPREPIFTNANHNVLEDARYELTQFGNDVAMMWDDTNPLYDDIEKVKKQLNDIKERILDMNALWDYAFINEISIEQAYVELTLGETK